MKKSFLYLVTTILLLAFVLSSCGEQAPNLDAEYMEPTGGNSAQDTNTDTGIVDQRKVVITAKYTIESLEFDTATDAIETAVTAVGGYISSSQVTPSTEKRQGSATYVLKVPAEKTNAFMDTLDGIGNVVNRSVTTSDVTLTYTDLSSRVATLEAEETRVRKLLEDAASLNEILTIERRLTEISSELTSLKNQLATLENRVTYSTFNVTLKDVTEYTVEEKEKDGYFKEFGQSFVASFKIFVDILGGILIVVVYLLPYALVAAGIILIIWLVKRRKKKVEVPKEEAPATPQSKGEALPTNEGLFSQE